MLSRLVITFLPRSKHLLISWLQSPSAVILEPKKIKSVTTSTFSLSICHEVMGPAAKILVFCWLFTLLLPSSRGFLVPPHFLPLEWYHLHIWGCWYFSQQSWFQFDSSTFCMMYSAYKLNKQDDNIQPWHTPFPIWNQSAVPCSVLTVASWAAYRFLKRKVRWSGVPISFRIFHSLPNENSWFLILTFYFTNNC